jgi:hypothetical protein
MEPAKLEDSCLDLGWHLVRAGIGMSAAVRQTSDALSGITAQPAVHGLAAHAIAAGDVGDAGPILEHFEHGLKPLFHETQLHQHGTDLLG